MGAFAFRCHAERPLPLGVILSEAKDPYTAQLSRTFESSSAKIDFDRSIGVQKV
jgi:hypothetical protein